MGAQIGLSTQLSFGAVGSQFSAETKKQLNALATYTLVALAGGATAGPALLMIQCSPNDLVEYTPDAGVTYRTIIPAGASGMYFVDGFNFRLRNTGVADAGAVNTYITHVLGIV